MLVNNMLLPLLSETVWFDKYRYDEAERLYEERNAKQQKQVGTTVTSASTRTTAENTTSITTTKGSIAEEIAKTRQRIQNSLKNASLKTETEDLGSLNQRVQKLESETREVRALVTELQTSMKMVLDNIQQMQEVLKSQGLSTGVVAPKSGGTPQAKEQAPKSGGGDDDDDIDLFGSDEEEDEAASKLREERLKAYESKKAKKAPVVGKSSVVLDVKPWDDETDLKEMETKVREIQTDGLVWGASKLVPLAYGINKLQIMAVVEDEKVSIDWLQETIQEIEDLVQSVDIAAFNKL